MVMETMATKSKQDANVKQYAHVDPKNQCRLNNGHLETEHQRIPTGDVVRKKQSTGTRDKKEDLPQRPTEYNIYNKTADEHANTDKKWGQSVSP